MWYIWQLKVRIFLWDPKDQHQLLSAYWLKEINGKRNIFFFFTHFPVYHLVTNRSLANYYVYKILKCIIIPVLVPNFPIKIYLRKMMWLYAILINTGDKQKYEEKSGVPLLASYHSCKAGIWNGHNSWLLPIWFWFCLTYILGFRKEFLNEWPKIKKSKSKFKQTFLRKLPIRRQEKDKSEPHFLWVWEILTLELSLLLFNSVCLFIKHLLLLTILCTSKGWRKSGENKAELRTGLERGDFNE